MKLSRIFPPLGPVLSHVELLQDVPNNLQRWETRETRVQGTRTRNLTCLKHSKTSKFNESEILKTKCSTSTAADWKVHQLHRLGLKNDCASVVAVALQAKIGLQ